MRGLTRTICPQVLPQQLPSRNGQTLTTSSPTTKQGCSRMAQFPQASSSSQPRPPMRSMTSLIQCNANSEVRATTTMLLIFIAQFQPIQAKSHLHKSSGFRLHKPTEICRSKRYLNRSIIRLTRPSACLLPCVA